MESKIFGLLIMFCMFLCIYQLSPPLHHNPFLSEALRDSEPRNNGVAHSSKLGRGGEGGTSGGGRSTSTGSGGNGKADSGGAVNNHHPKTHRGTSTSSHNCVGLIAFMLIAFASVLLFYIVY